MPATDPLLPLDAATPPFFAGVDVGGTNTKIGIVDDRGRPVAFRAISTDVRRGPQEGTDRIGQALVELVGAVGLAAAAVAQVGLATPGTMDIPAGMMLEPHNLPGWNDFPVRDCLSRRCGKPVTYANDASAAAYGEYWRGRGRDFQSLLLITLGTGIGGGIILDGSSLDGQHCHGAECGHVIIDYHENARRCACGQAGHLEAYASAKAVVYRTREALEGGRASSISRRLQAADDVLSPRLIAAEAEAGDELAREIVFDTARYLGIGITSILHTVDPAAVALGGAMTFGGGSSPLGQAFLERVRQEIRARAFPVLAEQTLVDFATLGSAAGYIGAAGLARADHLRNGGRNSSDA